MCRAQELSGRLPPQDIFATGRFEQVSRVGLPALELPYGQRAGETRHVLPQVSFETRSVEAVRFTDVARARKLLLPRYHSGRASGSARLHEEVGLKLRRWIDGVHREISNTRALERFVVDAEIAGELTARLRQDHVRGIGEYRRLPRAANNLVTTQQVLYRGGCDGGP